MGKETSRKIAAARGAWLAAVCAGALLCALIGTAFAGRPAAAPVTPAPAVPVRHYLNLLRNPLTALNASRARFGLRPLTASAAGTRGARRRAHRYRIPRVKPFVLETQIDAGYMYTLQTTRTLPIYAFFFGRLVPLPYKIVRTNLATGAHQTIFTGNTTSVLAMFAQHGRLLLSLARIADDGDNRVTIDTQIAGTDGPDQPLHVIDAQTFNAKDDNICGSGDLLDGAADDGSPVIVRIAGVCGGALLSTTTQQLTITGGGTRVLRDALPGSLVLGGPAAQLAGNTLYGANARGEGYEAIDLTTGARTRYWDGAASIAASRSANDGSIALLSGSDDAYTGDSVGYFGYSSPSIVDGMVVVFPAGNADAPAVVKYAGDGLLTNVAYCGTKLYAIAARQAERRGQQDYFDFSTFSIETSRLRVSLVDAGARQFNVVGQTKPVHPTGIGCDGDNLLVAYGRGTKQAIARFGP